MRRKVGKMKSKAKLIIMILITSGIIFALLPVINNGLKFNTRYSNNNTSYNSDFNMDNKNPKISAVSGKIHIDNNWTDAKDAGICTGNGTYSEPYVIEDLVIDGGGTGNGIVINNSRVYFKIENCTITNSESYFAGIYLDNSTNGQLINNNCSLNSYGIYLDGSDNTTINGNVLFNNGYGIRLYSSHRNNVSSNRISHNGIGISLMVSWSNIISNNILYNHSQGIYLWASSHNEILENIVNNAYTGITLSGDWNTVQGNTLIVTYQCIAFNYGEGNSIYNNSCIGDVSDDNGDEVPNSPFEGIFFEIILVVVGTIFFALIGIVRFLRKGRKTKVKKSRLPKDEVARYKKLKELEGKSTRNHDEFPDEIET